MKTQIKVLDSFWDTGLKPGGLIVIAGRPAIGKTSFLLLIAKNLAKHYKTQLISLETSISGLKKRKIYDSIFIDDSPEINLERLISIIRENQPEAVLIDYIQLMNENTEKLMYKLKNIAVTYNICFIVSSQIGRDPEKRVLLDRRPNIGDLTANGKLFSTDNIACIDNLTFFYRDHYYNKLTQDPDKIELIQYENGNMKVLHLDWELL